MEPVWSLAWSYRGALCYAGSMPVGSGPRRARGEIERLPSGSLRVRVYVDVDPVSRKRRYLSQTVPAGPEAEQAAERVRDRLLREVEARRVPRTEPRPATAPSDASRVDRGRGQLTVAAIARLAGVSPPTVSKVLNGRAGVAPETRRNVERLLREQGYRRPEKVARAACVEVVFYGMQGHLAVEIMRGVKQVAVERGLAVGYTDVRGEESTGRRWAQDLLTRRPTGVILVHMGFTLEQYGLLSASGIPLVALDPTSEPLSPVPSVSAANRHGGIAAAQHVLDIGHRRIAVITGPPERLCARARLDGVRTAMAAAGVPLDKRLVRTGMWFSFEGGFSQARDLLRLPEPPTAVLCGNDLQAFGVYEAARQAGTRIPDDLAVVGFDDVSYARWCGPPMTTVRQPAAELGATAARLVLALAAGGTITQTHVELATTLVVRASTAPPRTR
jgi:LacI family transcriptional regulator, xylobiose transport system transcriptional regulator